MSLTRFEKLDNTQDKNHVIGVIEDVNPAQEAKDLLEDKKHQQALDDRQSAIDLLRKKAATDQYFAALLKILGI